VGLEKVIEQRSQKRSMGIGADVKGTKEKSKESPLTRALPEDLLRFGMIPEFIGRLPVLATLNELDEPSLVRILTEPKNAIIKQYQKLFEFENVKLNFSESALNTVAKEALKSKTGARGLRSILENSMLDIMYELPSIPNLKECNIDDNVILKTGKPELVYNSPEEQAAAAATASKKESA